MRKIKRYTALLCLAAMLLLLCGCGGADTSDDYVDGKSAGKYLSQMAAADDVFSLNYNSAYSMNPLVATNTNNQLVCCLVYDNMLELTNSYSVEYNIITAYSSSDGGQTWTFKVEPGRKFHDGSDVSAYDVAYSIQCARGSDRFRDRLSYVAGCSANDAETLTVSLSKKNMMFPMLLTVPVIKSGSYGESYPIGSGPYTYASDHLSLVASEHYPNYRALPLKTVYLKEYTGIDDTISAFQDSYIDAVLNDPTATTNLGYGSANEIRAYNSTNLHYIGFNVQTGIFTYDAMRFAMNYAFDREYLVEQMGSYGMETPFVVTPAAPGYSKTAAKEFDYDLNTVKTVFANLGLSDYDGDGFLEMRNGTTLVNTDIDFIVCNASSIKVNMARRFASDMASIGINVTVEELPWSDYKARVEAGNYDMYYAEVRMNPDCDPSKLLVTGSSLNYALVSDQRVEEAIALFLQSDEDGRADAAVNMCNVIATTAYIVPLCYERHQLVSHRGVIEGIKACENNPFYDMKSWTVNLKTKEN